MFLIVGLGNPGMEYEHTRHNVGFDALDLIAKRYNININRAKFKGMCGDGIIVGEKVLLLKPQTYMNLSGESVEQASSFFKIPPENIIIFHDDVTIEVGRVRIREKGSSGGHNGLKSIIACINSQEFIRVKIGVGGPKENMIAHVLGKLSADERKSVDNILECCSNIAATIIEKGTDEAKNKFNGMKED